MTTLEETNYLKTEKTNDENEGEKKGSKPEEPTPGELDVVTSVFKSFETGIREGSMFAKDLHAALKMLGLNPLEQEVLDLTNEVARNGLIYFPEFCQIVTKKYREEDQEVFRQNMFKTMCGTRPYDEKFKAKKYKLQEHSFSREDFYHIMRNLPEEVSDSMIEEMFSYADADHDGRINWSEFQTMINPPHPDTWADRTAAQTIRDMKRTPTMLHPHILSVSSMANREAQIQAKKGAPLLIHNARVVPLCISETHVSASWSQIGLPSPWQAVELGTE